MDPETNELDQLRAARDGNAQILNDLLARYRTKLCRMLDLRLDRRVQGRVDASDVIQEAYVEANQRLDEYLDSPDVPFYVWLRFITSQKLAQIHRRQLGVQARNAARDVSLYRGPLPEATSAALAAQLVGKLTAPSQAIQRAEVKRRLQEALNGLDALSREVLILRHFEHLSNIEIAHVLEISESGACKRYVRALQKLKQVLAESPGGLQDWIT